MDMLAEYRALNAGIAQIDTIHRDLVVALRSVGRDVDSLLNGDWTGPAAQAFSGGWGDWSEDVDAVLSALDTTRQLMTEAVVDLERTDAGVAGRAVSLQSRLGVV